MKRFSILFAQIHPMKTGMFYKIRIAAYDIYSLVVFFAGTTIALFSKKYYLFDGFHPVFYAALFGFMMSLAFKSLWGKNLAAEETKKNSFLHFLINTIFISGMDFILLALSLFIVWYISRLQGIIVINDVSFWPNALLLCICLGICYSFYSYMEEGYLRKMFNS